MATPVVTFRINVDKTTEPGVEVNNQPSRTVQNPIPPPASQLITPSNSSNVLHRAFSMPLNQQNDLLVPMTPLQATKSANESTSNETNESNAVNISENFHQNESNEPNKINSISWGSLNVAK